MNEDYNNIDKIFNFKSNKEIPNVKQELKNELTNIAKINEYIKDKLSNVKPLTYNQNQIITDKIDKNTNTNTNNILSNDKYINDNNNDVLNINGHCRKIEVPNLKNLRYNKRNTYIPTPTNHMATSNKSNISITNDNGYRNKNTGSKKDLTILTNLNISTNSNNISTPNSNFSNNLSNNNYIYQTKSVKNESGFQSVLSNKVNEVSKINLHVNGVKNSKINSINTSSAVNTVNILNKEAKNNFGCSSKTSPRVYLNLQHSIVTKRDKSKSVTKKNLNNIVNNYSNNIIKGDDNKKLNLDKVKKILLERCTEKSNTTKVSNITLKKKVSGSNLNSYNSFKRIIVENDNNSRRKNSNNLNNSNISNTTSRLETENISTKKQKQQIDKDLYIADLLKNMEKNKLESSQNKFIPAPILKEPSSKFFGCKVIPLNLNMDISPYSKNTNTNTDTNKNTTSLNNTRNRSKSVNTRTRSLNDNKDNDNSINNSINNNINNINSNYCNNNTNKVMSINLHNINNNDEYYEDSSARFSHNSQTQSNSGKVMVRSLHDARNQRSKSKNKNQELRNEPIDKNDSMVSDRTDRGKTNRSITSNANTSNVITNNANNANSIKFNLLDNISVKKVKNEESVKNIISVNIHNYNLYTKDDMSPKDDNDMMINKNVKIKENILLQNTNRLEKKEKSMDLLSYMNLYINKISCGDEKKNLNENELTDLKASNTANTVNMTTNSTTNSATKNKFSSCKIINDLNLYKQNSINTDSELDFNNDINKFINNLDYRIKVQKDSTSRKELINNIEFVSNISNSNNSNNLSPAIKSRKRDLMRLNKKLESKNK